MSEGAPPDMTAIMQEMAQFWRSAMDVGAEAGKSWTASMMPFMANRIAEGSAFGVGQGGEISEAIKRMSEGPRLADLWDMDRRVMATMAAWMEIRQRMASYNAIAAMPWQRTMDRYNQAMAADGEASAGDSDWRKAFAVWTSIANEELINNQRSKAFLEAQRDLLKSSLELRAHQQDLADAAAKLFGLPTQQALDEVTRALTELRREFRAHLRSHRDDDRGANATKKSSRSSRRANAPSSPEPRGDS